MDKLLQLIGLAKRAGRLAQGEDMALEAIAKRTARCALLTKESADSTVRKTRNACGDKVAVLVLPCTKAELGGALGREICAVAAVTDMGLAVQIARLTVALDPTQSGALEQVLRKQEKLARRKEKKPRKK